MPGGSRGPALPSPTAMNPIFRTCRVQLFRFATADGIVRFAQKGRKRPPREASGATTMPPSGGGLVESLLFSLDAVFDELVPLAV